MLRNHVKPFLIPLFINTFKESVRRYVPRRALLYVPGSDLKKLDKSFNTDVDCIMMDCEDGVAFKKKAQARLNIRELLDKGKPTKKCEYDLGVRINSMDTGFIKDDLSVIVTGKNVPDTILLPKVETPNHLKLFSEQLKEFMGAKYRVHLIMGIESAQSFVNLHEICREAHRLGENSNFLPVGLLFGSDDFCASIGATRSESSLEVLYARQKLVLVAKAFNLQAIDMVYIKYQDLEGLKRQAEEGARMGYTGKQVIHPGQIPIVQDAFFPTKQQLEWASALLKTFHEHQEHGQGAFTYEGSMIDMPTVRQAQNIMDLSNAVMIREH